MARRRSRYVFSGRPERHPVRNFFRFVLLLLVLIALLITVVNFGINNSVQLEKVSVTVSDLPADLENWSILLFSDLHGRQIGQAQSGIANAIGTPIVSCVIFAGDMMPEDGNVTALLDLVALCPSDKPIFYLPGDEDPPYLDETAHASLSPLSAWAEQLQKKGVTILDRPVLCTRGTRDQARIWFIPADLYTLDLDAYELLWQGKLDRLNAKSSLTADEAAQKRVAEYQLTRIGDIRTAISEIREGDIQIAVAHVPVTAMEMGEATRHDSRDTVFSLRQADLIVAGHYCGGQTRLPLIGAVHVPEMGWWPGDTGITGMMRLTGVPQYISPGLGVS